MSDAIDQPVDTQPRDLPAADTQPQDASRQVTSKIPKTQPAKNPKCVAAGEAVAERTREAREAQKKAAAEAAVIIENDRQKRVAGEAPPAETPPVEAPPAGFTTNQWLAVASFGVSLLGIFYKHGDIKKMFTTERPPKTPPLHALHGLNNLTC